MKKSILAILICLAAFSVKAQTINFTVNTVSASNSITCANPSVVVTATSNFSGGTVSYYWANNSTTITGNTATLTTPGIYTVAAVSIPNYATQTISIGVNTVAPVSALTPTTLGITCSVAPSPVTLTVISPTINFISSILAPAGGSITNNAQVTSYVPSSQGVYTTIVTNQTNGCMTIKNFTVTSLYNYPSFTISSPSNFSLGCNTKSVASVFFTATINPPVSLTYTFLSPGSSTILPAGPLSTSGQRTINISGTWTVICRDIQNNCDIKLPFSIIQNTFGPTIDNLTIPIQTLDCNTPSVTLLINSTTPNVSYSWELGINYQNGASFLVNANQSAPTSTAIGNVTCTILDNDNKCTTQTLIPMYQNVFKPNTIINALGSNIRACITNSLVLFNQSSTGIPTNSTFSNTLPVVAQTWLGHPSQPTLTLSSTYTAMVAGIYTLTAKDLNNGCTADATFIVEDCTGLGEISTKEKIQFYPNPCSNHLSILTETNSDQEIMITDMLGQTITKIHLNNSHSIDVSQLPKGVYFISVSQNNKVIETSKFIKD